MGISYWTSLNSYWIFFTETSNKSIVDHLILFCYNQNGFAFIIIYLFFIVESSSVIAYTLLCVTTFVISDNGVISK